MYIVMNNIKLNKIMKNVLIKLLIIGNIFFFPLDTDAQIDTAHISYAHINQYIYPHLMDTSYSSVATIYDPTSCLPNDAEFTCSPLMLYKQPFELTKGFAQRYEVRNDSIKIVGVAMMISDVAQDLPWETHSITISIWDSTMSNELYSESFIDGGCHDSYQTPPNSSYPFLEFIFSDTLTLYEDYHVAVIYPKICNDLERSNPIFMALSDYVCSDVPYGISTKYKPYIMLGCENSRDWQHVDSVSNWGIQSYHSIAKYEYMQDTTDTAVYKAIGICPIKALENSIITGDDSTGTGSGSTGTGDDTTSTGGGSQDSYIATVLADEDIELYPNPADEVLNIRSEYNITEIEVIDAMNRVIEHWELNSRELTLDVASYKSGTYFIIIKTDKGSLTKKFIVQ